MDKVIELQNLNDELYKLVEVLENKETKKEPLTIQAELLEEMTDKMRDLLTTITV